MSFLTMAFADGAFEAPDLTTLERVYIQSAGRAWTEILGHGSTVIYQEHYRNAKVCTIQCDVEYAFAGLPTDDGLLKSANLMSRAIDARTPWTLDKAEIADIEQSSQEFQRLMLEVLDARNQCFLYHALRLF